MNYFNYFSEIEETFVRRRGHNLLLSPLDWALIETWQERGVPLHVVLRGVETVFDGIDGQPARKRNVKSLFYCKEEIEAQYAEWLERQVGKNGAKKAPSSKFQVSSFEADKLQSSEEEIFPAETVKNHLEKVTADLQKASQSAVNSEWREVLTKVIKHLTKLKQNLSAKNLEEELERLEDLIDKNLLAIFANEKQKNEIKKQIAAYRTKMDEEVYQKTFDLMLLKRLREEAEIPRLTLFYL